MKTIHAFCRRLFLTLAGLMAASAWAGGTPRTDFGVGGLDTVAPDGSRRPVTAFCVHAQRGSDANPGTAARPFATAARARDAVRALKKAGTFPADGVTVELSGHFDSLRGLIVDLGPEDGGLSATNPVVWCAGREGCFLTGACRLGADDFTPVAGGELGRLRPEARGKVYRCDLAKAGVAPLAPLPAKFNIWTEMELVSSGAAMTIARYPNRGWLEITNVIDRGVAPCDPSVDEWEFGVRGGTFEYAGDAPARWDAAKGVYLFGYWSKDWASDTLRVAKIDSAKKTITMEGIHKYGLGKNDKWGSQKVRYYAYNLLEELDAPGEWYVDRPARTLYFYPTAAGFAEVALSVAREPLVRLRGTRHVVLRGFDLRHSTGLAVDAADCRDLRLEDLSVAWLSQEGVRVTGGADATVSGCRLAQIGATGLRITGGDRRRLVKCNHRVTDCDIGFCGRLARISGPCIRFEGCGVTVERNRFHDTPYIAVTYGGNEHLFQYNEVACAMLEAGDGAGIYTGRDWGSRGNVVRWNYLHHFGRDGVALRAAQGRPCGCEPIRDGALVEGLYLDDCDSGETIFGNLFYRAGCAMFTGGGRDNRWRQNLVIDCLAAAHFDVRGLYRAKPGSGLKNGWDLLARIEALGYTEEPWRSRYPELLGVMEKEPLLPIGTEYVSNVAIRCGCFFHVTRDARPFLRERAPNRANVSLDARDDRREAGEYPATNALQRAKLEFRSDAALSAAAVKDPLGVQDTPAFRAAFPGFPRIPVGKIGPRPRRVCP